MLVKFIKKKNYCYIEISTKMKFSKTEIGSSVSCSGACLTIEKYNKIGVKIIFVHQVPLQTFTPSYIYLHSIKKDKLNYQKFLYNLSVDYKKHVLFQKFVRNRVNLFNERSLFDQINVDKIFCDKIKCIVGTEEGSYYSDDDHLSIFGSMKLKDEIKKFLD